MSELNERVEAFARILAAIESRKSGWGFTLDQAIEYRAEKWRRHVYEAEQLLDEMGPWLAEHDRQVAERAWDECATKAQDLGRLDETAIPWLRGQSPYRKTHVALVAAREADR